MPNINPHVSIQALSDTQAEIKLLFRDFLGGLSLVTGFMTQAGLNILEAIIKTEGDRVHDVFKVESSKPIKWDEVEEGLNQFFNQIERDGADQVRKALRKDIVASFRDSRVKKFKLLYPIAIHINQDESPTETVVLIESQDTEAFLYALTSALSALEININRMEVETIEGRVHDRLWLTYRGLKIDDEKKIKQLRWAILMVKKFTHLLPSVPDPEIALEQFYALGKDLLESESFESLIDQLGNSDALDKISRVLGTGSYLWEELVRTQYESVIPIFKNESLLKKRCPKDKMQLLLDQKLSTPISFEEKCKVLNDFKNYEMFRIDLRHLLGEAPYIGEFTEEFSDLVEVVVNKALTLSLEELKIPREGLGLFALGKFGGREIGYASDLEILFVYDDTSLKSKSQEHEAMEKFSELVRLFSRAIESKAEGVFELDLRLRPYGQDGPLATPLSMFRTYYEKPQEAWNYERQSMLKLRYLTGSDKLTQEVLQIRDRFVFSERPFNFKEAVKLRYRQQRELAEEGKINIKYSAGGLLDVEYLIQTLQIVYGRKNIADIRHPNTLRAMRSLWQVGVLSEKQFQDLRAAYLFLRNVINNLRIVRGHAKDLNLPDENSEGEVALARRLYFSGSDKQVCKQLKLVTSQFREIASRTYELWMKELSETDWNEILKRIKTPSFSLRVSLDEILKGTLDDEGKEVLRTMGFLQPEEALLKFQKLCPNMQAFEHFAKVMDDLWEVWPMLPSPDLALKQLGWYMDRVSNAEVTWKDFALQPERLALLVKIFSVSEYFADIICSNPEGYEWIYNKEERALDVTETKLTELKEASLSAASLREFKRQESLRIGLLEYFDEAPLEDIYKIYSDLADFMISQVARLAGLDREICILAFGKLGARELNFSSDIDLMFVSNSTVHVELQKKIESFFKIMKEGSSYEFLYRVDLRLRPHGDSGSFCLTVKEYENYYQHRAEGWEMLALLKARCVFGDLNLGDRWLKVVSPFLWRRAWPESMIASIREVKKKYESKTAKEDCGDIDIKLSPGGIRDIEFTLQYIQLMEGFGEQRLRVRGTFDTLRALNRLHALPKDELQVLERSYIFLRKIENRLHFYRNRQLFKITDELKENRWLAKSIGFISSEEKLPEKQLALMLREQMKECRRIFERVFYQGHYLMKGT